MYFVCIILTISYKQYQVIQHLLKASTTSIESRYHQHKWRYHYQKLLFNYFYSHTDLIFIDSAKVLTVAHYSFYIRIGEYLDLLSTQILTFYIKAVSIIIMIFCKVRSFLLHSWIVFIALVHVSYSVKVNQL